MNVTHDNMICIPIGYIRSPFKEPSRTPKAGAVKPDVEACLELNGKYAEAAASIEPGHRIMVIFWFHLSGEYSQTVHWRGYGKLMGLFSTHSPSRPNPIGVSTVTVTRIEFPDPGRSAGGRTAEPVRIWFTGVDMTDGTPVLDIKSEDLYP